MIEPTLVHLFLDTPLYMVRDKVPVAQVEAPAVAVVAAEPAVESEPEPEAKVVNMPSVTSKPIRKPLPELQGGALFLIDRKGGETKVEHAALEMIHKIGAAMKFDPAHIWMEAADFSEYDLTETAVLSTGARVVLLMGHPLPVRELFGVSADFTLRRAGEMLLVSAPSPELLLPNRDGRAALWQGLKAALGL